MKRLPIQAAKDIATKYDQSQVILVTWDENDEMVHAVSYGQTLTECSRAAMGANMVKRALGFPESKCNDKPARMRRKGVPSVVDKAAAREKYLRFMAGWRAGAAIKPVPTDLERDKDYTAGYATGRKAYQVAAAMVDEDVGHDILIVKPPRTIRIEDTGNKLPKVSPRAVAEVLGATLRFEK